MPMIEMSEDEARALKGSKALMDQLLKNPKTRRDTEKLVKTLYPETTITDDIAAPYVEDIKELRTEFKAFLKSQEDQKIESKFNGQLQQLRDQGYTEDGLDKIKKLMVDESLPNALAAAAYYEKQHPPEPMEPSALSPSDWGFGAPTDDEDTKLLFKSVLNEAAPADVVRVLSEAKTEEYAAEEATFTL